MICRVCGHKMVIKEVLKNCRNDYLKLERYPCEFKTKEMTLYQCAHCTHIQCAYDMQEGYYEAYLSYSGAQQYYGACKKRDLNISKLRKYAESNESIIEIGCGVGDALQFAKAYFKECIGIEPAVKLYELATQRGHKVINDYFNADLKLKETFTAFMSFQVFEHLEEVEAVIKYAYEILEEGGVGLINVPNGQQIFEEGLYHQIIAEHINYFTPLSLTKLVEQHGFRIIEIESDIETVEINIYIKKPKLSKTLNQIREEQQNILNNHLKDKNKIIIWGAGAKASIYSMLLPSTFYTNEKQIHLIDSDNEKIGKYVSGIPLKIESISKTLVEESEIVIIFASAYNTEIISYLQKELAYKGEIVYFHKNSIRIIDCKKDMSDSVY